MEVSQCIVLFHYCWALSPAEAAALAVMAATVTAATAAMAVADTIENAADSSHFQFAAAATGLLMQ
jgi:hypothetical protein